MVQAALSSALYVIKYVFIYITGTVIWFLEVHDRTEASIYLHIDSAHCHRQHQQEI